METILSIQNLVKAFPEVTAVDHITFSIKRGTCFGLLGPNGAGKTTTIEVVEGIMPFDSGGIFYNGRKRDEQFYEDIGIQFQDTELPQYLTVQETLKTFQNLYSRKADFDYLVDICSLAEILKRDNRKISGGQRQRLFLAMALANNPELLFLDEPTTGLDPQARRNLWDIVNKIKSDNKTIILTTHYMEEAQILCDVIAIMDQGKIIAMGTPEELFREHCSGNAIVLNGEVSEELLRDVPGTYYFIEGGVEINTGSINGSILALIDAGVDLSGISVRSQNLEDLFLKLTGRQLRL